MNCKPGDLAIIINSCGDNVGKMVTCLEYIGKPPGFWEKPYDYWRIKERLPSYYINGRFANNYDPYIADRNLMPIRPDEAAKEQTKELETI